MKVFQPSWIRVILWFRGFGAKQQTTLCLALNDVRWGGVRGIPAAGIRRGWIWTNSWRASNFWPAFQDSVDFQSPIKCTWNRPAGETCRCVAVPLNIKDPRVAGFRSLAAIKHQVGAKLRIVALISKHWYFYINDDEFMLWTSYRRW